MKTIAAAFLALWCFLSAAMAIAAANITRHSLPMIEDQEMKHKLTIAIAAAVLASSGAGAETATSRALNACSKLSGAPYHACLDRIPKCEAVLTRDVDDYWHKGMVFDISGGSQDPGMLCQHGGNCIPVSAVRFKTPCLIVDQKSADGPYYHWERGK
jgi:hypothetical protein